ncbi:MAG: type VI secretion system accessory protein TagJ [Pyrinomonadaceae bacterium]
MKEAKIKLDNDDLSGAIEEVLNVVRSNPTDVRARTFLFELSCFDGNWDRAQKQLDVIGQQDVNAMIGSQILKQNVAAEQDRLRVFDEGMIPECLMPPPIYVEDLLLAMTHLREGRLEEARKHLDKAEEARPAFSCVVDGVESEDFRDYNDFTSCVFEAIVKDSYAWIPFEQVSRVKFFEPKSLRDLFWIHAEVEMINGTVGEMFLPAVYANSFKSDDGAVKLGRVTDWVDAGGDVFVGEGGRLYSAGGEMKSMISIRELEFRHPEGE